MAIRKRRKKRTRKRKIKKSGTQDGRVPDMVYATHRESYA